MTISSVKLRQGTGGSSIADGAVTSAKIADGAVTSAKIADGTIVDADINAAAAISPSKISGTAVVTSDARLSDARTPTAHKASHATGGSDALSPADIGAAPATGISPSAITGTAVITSDARLSDTRTPSDGSVTTAKIVDGAVTNAKLENNSITLNGSAVALGGSATIDGLPSQTGNSGKYLTTDGSSASWATVSGGSAAEPTYTNHFMLMGA